MRTLVLIIALGGCEPPIEESVHEASSSEPPAGPWVQVSAGGVHSCALDREGRAHCWGKEEVVRDTPDELRFASIEAGGEHTCGLTPEGQAHCWGVDVDGSTHPPQGRLRDLSAGFHQTCALNEQGEPVCWGRHLFRRLRAPDGGLAAIALGTRNGCALGLDGEPSCWGEPALELPELPSLESMALGRYHGCALDREGAAICFGVDVDGETSPPAGRFAQLDVGIEFACARTEAGEVHCWGQDCSGEQRVPSASFATIDLGYYHACGVTREGELSCWGWADHGQLAREQAQSAGPSTCPYEGLGLEYARIGRFDRAEPLLTRAIELAPGIEPSKYTALAEIEIQRGDLDAARTLLETSLSIDPHDPSAARLLASIEARRPDAPTEP